MIQLQRVSTISANAFDARARRAAKRIGLLARKSRWRAGTIDNRGGFRLESLRTGLVVAGERFDWAAGDVIEFCERSD